MSSNTTIKLTKAESDELGIMAMLTNTTKSKLVSNIIKLGFEKIYPNFPYCLNSGDFLDLSYIVTAKPHVDLITGSYTCDFNAPQSQTDAKTAELLKTAFEKLDSEKEFNKSKFKKALEALA